MAGADWGVGDEGGLQQHGEEGGGHLPQAEASPGEAFFASLHRF